MQYQNIFEAIVSEMYKYRDSLDKEESIDNELSKLWSQSSENQRKTINEVFKWMTGHDFITLWGASNGGNP